MHILHSSSNTLVQVDASTTHTQHAINAFSSTYSYLSILAFQHLLPDAIAKAPCKWCILVMLLEMANKFVNEKSFFIHLKEVKVTSRSPKWNFQPAQNCVPPHTRNYFALFTLPDRIPLRLVHHSVASFYSNFWPPADSIDHHHGRYKQASFNKFNDTPTIPGSPRRYRSNFRFKCVVDISTKRHRAYWRFIKDVKFSFYHIPDYPIHFPTRDA